jgi:hypothetical protein
MSTKMGRRSSARGRQEFLPPSDDTDEFIGDDEDGSFAKIKSQQFQNDLYELVPTGWVGLRPPSVPFCLCVTFRLSPGGWEKAQRSRSPEKTPLGKSWSGRVRSRRKRLTSSIDKTLALSINY